MTKSCAGRVHNPYAALTILAALALSGCTSQGQSADPSIAASRPATRSQAATAAPSCSPTGAHAAHQGGFFNCQICHPCGGVLAIATTKLPDGFQVSGTATKDASGGASCTVTCHGSQTVSWNGGPLGCSQCHGQWQGGPGVVSTHGIDASKGLTANLPVCTQCHNTANHFDPNMAVVNADTGTAVPVSSATAAQVTTFCKSCHDGLGKTILGETPPLLLGYDTTASGDFHGARAGTGFGGTLTSNFAVGQAPLDCLQCHDPHASTNAFLFGPTVNSQSIGLGAISRAGLGGEALCSACHVGDFHAGCKVSGCHDDKTTITSAITGLPTVVSSALVTPAGKPCFFCHGHEGIVNFSLPSWDNHPNYGATYCDHCHSDWMPNAVPTTPPVVSNLAVTSITQTSATITFSTNVFANTYVEWGTTDVTSINGTGALATSHAFTLTNLTQGTTYKYRVRTSDPFRNFAEAPALPATFTTTLPLPPNTPTIPTPLHPNGPADEIAVDCSGSCSSTFDTTLSWTAVPSPDGNPVTYRVVLSTSPTFAGTPLLDTTISGTSRTVTGLLLPTSYYDSTNPATINRYYWRVMAINKVANTNAGWSSTASFDAYIWTMM